MGIQPASMQKEYRSPPLRAPIEIMKAHPMYDDVMRLGQDDFRQFKAGEISSQPEVFDLFGIA